MTLTLIVQASTAFQHPFKHVNQELTTHMTQSLPSQWKRSFRLQGAKSNQSTSSLQWPTHLKRAFRRDIQLGLFAAIAFSWLSVSGYSAFTVAQAQDMVNHQAAGDKNQTEQLQQMLEHALYQEPKGTQLSTVNLDHSFINRYSESVLRLTAPDDETDEPLHLNDKKEEVAINLFLKELEDIQQHAAPKLKKKSQDLGPLDEDITLSDPVAKSRVNVTSRFGWRHGRRHNGMDYAAPIGTAIIASASGRVVSAGWDTGYGKMVTIDHGNGIVTRYAHCSTMMVHAGQKVKKGQAIGKIGMTGHSTGPHVHFELMANGIHINPSRYTNKAGMLITLRNNGHKS